MVYLVLVRHGESRWNQSNKFTGWVDVPLSENGINEALKTAKELKNFNVDVAFTSKLSRAHETLLLIFAQQHKTGIFLHKSRWRKLWSLHNGQEFQEDEIPIHSSEKLNERYYGALQGMNKDDARHKWGKEQVHLWRRSYAVRPPKGESLKDVFKRAVPYFKSTIMKHVKANQNVIVSAHGNSLRAIVKYIEHISDHDIPHLELATGKPIIYEYKNGELKRVSKQFSFDRPIQWSTKNEKSSRNKKTTTKKTAKKKVAKKKIAKKKPAKKKVAKRPTTKKKNTTIRKKLQSKKKPLQKKKVKKKTSRKTTSKKKTSSRKKTSKKKRR